MPPSPVDHPGGGAGTDRRAAPVIARLSRYAALMLCAVLTFAASPVPGWATQGSAAIAAGRGAAPQLRRLPNGMRYIVVPRRSAAPGDAPRVALRMRVDGGWLAETAGERGLAHLVEHLSIDGNGVLRAAEVIRLRDERVADGQWGAWTSPAATEYFLSSRTGDPAALGGLMAYFRGIVGGMRFEDDAIDRQRRVVADEMAARRIDDVRALARGRAFAPGSDLVAANGYDSGDVATADAATIERVYRRIYRPDHVTLVIVGDVDPAATARLVERTFGGWHAEAAPMPVPAPRPRAVAAPRISFDPAPGGPATVIVSLGVADAAAPRSEPWFVRDAVRQLVAIAINQRMAIRAARQGIARAGFAFDDDTATMQWQVLPGGDDWQDALAFALREVALLDAHGFDARNVAIAKRRLLRQLADERDAAAFVTNAQSAERVAAGLARGRVPVASATENAARRRTVASLDPERVARAWRAMRGTAAPRLRVESAALGGIAAPSARIAEVAARPAGRAPDPVTRSPPDPRRSLRRRPGTVVSDARGDDGVRRVAFANGMTLDLIRRSHGGKWIEFAFDIDAPAGLPGLSPCAVAILPAFLDAGGSVRRSATDLHESVMGSDIHVAPVRMSPTGLALTASARREDIDVAVPYLFERIAEPGFRTGGARAAAAQANGLIDAGGGDPAWGVLAAVERRLVALRTGDAAAADAACVAGFDMARARRSIAPLLAAGRSELAIAGDFDEAHVLALVARTFGAVPRGVRADTATGPAPPALPVVTLAAPAPGGGQAVHAAMWDLGAAATPHDRAMQQMFATVFARLLYARMVEQDGLGYAPVAERIELSTWFDRPVLFAAAVTAADRKARMAAVFAAVVERLRRAPPDADLLDTARRLSIDGLTASYGEDRTWAYLAAQEGRHRGTVATWLALRDALSAVTARDLHVYADAVLARQHLTLTATPTGYTP